MDDFYTFDAAAAYMEFLNGGAPLTDWQETQEWAAGVMRAPVLVIETEEEKADDE